jgi:aminoglycoside/choline kinase family phosphotransferase
MKKIIQNNIIDLFEQTFNEKVSDFELLPQSGSYREYCRLKSTTHSVIGAWNNDLRENIAFIEFSKHLKKNGIKVPEIYSFDKKKDIYLQEDLGNTTLFQYITDSREENGFSDSIIDKYKKVVTELPKLQIIAGKEIDYQKCHPRSAFDLQSMLWDLNYFKYYFLKLAKIPFNEQLLEDDFQSFANFLLETECDYFMYRDFQSRNIMLHNNEPWFIDYQGGRKGALQYDLASLLYDSKADIPQPVREELIDAYLNELEKIHTVNKKEFRQYFYGYVLIRMMQAMGAYGFRGFYEKKEHFLKSIPFAIENLKIVLNKFSFPVNLPELETVLRSIPDSDVLKKITTKRSELTVRVCSFSYKKGIPEDPSGNGGGYVFDCRAVHNPGRYLEYKESTGKDENVIEFFKENSDMEEFLNPIFKLVDQSVETYMERKFTHLCINFGCTGGQHRSVYATERISKYLAEKYHVNIITIHREQGDI